jgi:hypothetical protein
MPWTKARLKREAEKKQAEDEYRIQRELNESILTKQRMDYDSALRTSQSTYSLKDLREAKERKPLTAINAVRETPRPGYVTDYTSSSDCDDVAMFAAQSFIDNLQTSSAASVDSSTSSSCDTSSSSDSGSCDTSSW